MVPFAFAWQQNSRFGAITQVEKRAAHLAEGQNVVATMPDFDYYGKHCDEEDNFC